MRIFDFHTHIGHWARTENEKEPGSIFDLKKSLMDNDISKVVVMPPDGKSNKKLLEELRKSDFDYYFFPWIDPNNPEIIEFLSKNENHITGLKFSSSYDNIRGVTDSLYKPFVELALKNDLPVIIHCGRWVDMAGYQYAFELAEQYPELRVVCAHMGGVDKNLQVAAQDRIVKDSLKNIWFDTSAIRDSFMIERGVKLIGDDRFFYGSDYPLFSQEECIRAILSTSLSDKEKEALLWRNANVFLGENC